MQHRLFCLATSHIRDVLAFFYFLIFLNMQPLVVRISAQVCFVMLDDNKLSVAS